MRALTDRLLSKGDADAHRGPTDAATFRREAKLTAIGRLLLVRVIFAPLLAVFGVTFAFFEPSPWRRVVIGVVITVVFAVSYVEWLRSRRRGVTAISLPLNLAVMLTCQLAMLTATGGLFSPILPAVIVLSFMGSMIGEGAPPRLTAGLVIPTLWILAVAHHRVGLLPELFGAAAVDAPGSIESGVAPWLAAFVYSAMLLASGTIGETVGEALARLFVDGMDERDRRLAMHAEQTRALSALSAEIAHELKNPLASVKGLSALVARDATGKSLERVAVLRREVDRMQEILESLLNFSRPLVPLAMEEVEAGAIAEDVARMHEGAAVDRGLRVRVQASAERLTCDPRKVRQVLVNLVQNAIHASPDGADVVLAIEALEDAVCFEVLDRGAGIAPEIRTRLFEAGVTTKDDGSGIGLVVARSLARQHGGELTLEDREGGGCRAALTLPRGASHEAAA